MHLHSEWRTCHHWCAFVEVLVSETGEHGWGRDGHWSACPESLGGGTSLVRLCSPTIVAEVGTDKEVGHGDQHT